LLGTHSTQNPATVSQSLVAASAVQSASVVQIGRIGVTLASTGFTGPSGSPPSGGLEVDASNPL
jgi:hypothetical protein